MEKNFLIIALSSYLIPQVEEVRGIELNFVYIEIKGGETITTHLRLNI